MGLVSISGNGLVISDIASSGLLFPGGSAATLTIDGHYQQLAAGILAIEFGSAGYDVLSVSGTAALGGALEVSFLDGFAPGPGDRFEILAAGSRTGTFDTVAVAGGQFDVEYSNLDAVTDVRDFNQWNAAKFTSATVPPPLVEGQVPEPGSLVLLLAAGLIAAARIRACRIALAQGGPT